MKDAKVQLAGNIDVSGNEFGGIEVLKTSEAEVSPTLAVTDALLVNSTEVYGLPTIWETGVSGTVEGFKGTKITYNGGSNRQEHYYLDEENAKSDVTAIKVKDGSQITLVIDNINYTIKIGNGIPIWQLKQSITSVDGSKQSYIVTDSNGEIIRDTGIKILWFFLLEVIAEAGNKQIYSFILS